MTGVILLIEDNASHRKVYSALLRAHGYDPLEIADERTAIGIASEAGAKAIIVDILLPHIDGRQISNCCVKMTPRAPPRFWPYQRRPMMTWPRPALPPARIAFAGNRFR